MPQTRSGRSVSPSKPASPEKTRHQPMRTARLRSPSPFAETVPLTSVSPKKSASPRKRATSTSRSTRSSSRLSAASEDETDQASINGETPTLSDTSDQVDTQPGPSRLHRLPLDLEVVPETDEEQAQELDRSHHQHEDQTVSPMLSASSHTVVGSSTSAPQLETATLASDDQDDSQEQESDSDSESDSSSSSSSPSSSSSSSSDSDPDTDQDDADQEVDLDALLQASEVAYKQRSSRPAGISEGSFEDGEDLISFSDVGIAKPGSDSKGKSKQLPLVQLAKERFASNAGGQAPSSSSKSASSSNPVDKHIQAFDTGALSGFVKEKKHRGLKHKEQREATAGAGWFDMPEFGGSDAKLQANTKRSAAEAGKSSATGGDARVATAEQLRKEVQAIRLRNALDPKRFYRGGAKETGMPKYAQIGTIIASPLEPKNVLNRRERGRTVVDELIRDAEASAYAKRKFADVSHILAHSDGTLYTDPNFYPPTVATTKCLWSWATHQTTRKAPQALRRRPALAHHLCQHR